MKVEYILVHSKEIVLVLSNTFVFCLLVHVLMHGQSNCTRVHLYCIHSISDIDIIDSRMIERD